MKCMTWALVCCLLINLINISWSKQFKVRWDVVAFGISTRHMWFPSNYQQVILNEVTIISKFCIELSNKYKWWQNVFQAFYSSSTARRQETGGGPWPTKRSKRATGAQLFTWKTRGKVGLINAFRTNNRNRRSLFLQNNGSQSPFLKICASVLSSSFYGLAGQGKHPCMILLLYRDSMIGLLKYMYTQNSWKSFNFLQFF